MKTSRRVSSPRRPPNVQIPPWKAKAPKVDRKASAKAREDARQLKKAAADAEAESVRLTAQQSAIERAMFDPASAPAELGKLPMSELSRRRAEIAAKLEAAEARWIEANEQLETIAA